MRTTPPPNIQLKTIAQRRARIKPDLKAKLEEEYVKNPKPSRSEKHRIALQNDMSDDNVHFWFQNRRARASREAKQAGKQGKSVSGKNSDSVGRSIHGLTATSSSSSSSDYFFATHDLHSTSTIATPEKIKIPTTRLPSIISLLDEERDLTTRRKTPIIKSFFHHQEFGIESSFLPSQSGNPHAP